MVSQAEPSSLPPRAPLAVAAALFAAGIWLAGHLQRSPRLWGWSVAALIACAALAAWKARSSRLAHLSAMLAFICAGATARVEMVPPRIVVPPAEFLNGDAVEVEGRVTSDGSVRGGSGPRERFDLVAERLRIVDRNLVFTQPVGIRATAFQRDFESEPSPAITEFPQLAYGDRVRFTAKLRTPRNFRNTGAFDYQGYLRGLGIAVIASAPTEQIELLPGKSGARFGFWRRRIRRSILEHLGGSSLRPGLWNREDAALFAAMVIGEDSLLERNVREEFQKTGVYHLLVVSGMNVALLAFALFWLARRLRAPEWAATLITILLSAFYAYIAGMGVPIQRAVLMLAVFLLARLLYRDRASLNATGAAALAVLVWSPATLFDAGFQLTFLALLAISGIGLPVLARGSQPYRRALQHFDSTNYDLTLDPKLAQLRLDLRLIAGRLARFIGATPARWLVTALASMTVAAFELIVVSSITQAVLVLPMRAYFHRAAIIGLPANAAVLPLAGVMLNSAVAAIALSYISWPLARVVAWIAAGALHWTLACLGWLGHLHISQWRVPDAGWMISAIAAGGIVLALALVRRGGKLALATGGFALLASSMIAAFVVTAPRIEPGRLEITAIDVGQGDSLLLISPQGRTMLVDAGGSFGPARGEFDFGEDVVSPYLWSRGVDRLDVIALTHAHGDHIGGLARAVENFRPRELWVGINPETNVLKHLYEVCAANGVAVRRHVAGEELDWAGTHIRVLSPPADWQPKAKPMNDDSLAFLISFGHSRALLAGDLERKMEKFIAGEAPAADLLKVAHHGSATSTTPELLAAVHPRFAVISVGAHNPFGHPRIAVLQRLQDSRVLTYRTDLLGAVTFQLDGQSVQARLGYGP
ncbi:MAG TPA: ComEC/Rec2 family competence protein [Candidatus Angelobacter sp.]|nr:ComEC/Rec2 family competence protein [Candidatus Angelobacter sp.]